MRMHKGLPLMIARQEQQPPQSLGSWAWPLPAALRALNNPAFVLLWLGQLGSRFGDALFQLALTWWVLEQSGSAAALATLLTVALVPTILCLLVGGVVVDRVSRIRVMQLSDLLRGAVVGLAAALALFDQLQLWHLYGLNLIFGIVDAFFQPAYAAAVPEFVADEDLSSANALFGTSVQVGRIAGPALAAALVMLGGTPLAFSVNGLIFLCAAAVLVPLARLRGAAVPQQAPAAEGALTSLRAGIATVRTTPWLWRTIFVFALGNLTLGGPYSVALPFLVRDTRHGEVAVLSLLYACFATGYLLGGLWLARFRDLRQRGRLIYGGLALAGLTLGLLGLPLPLAALALVALVNGAALEIASLAWMHALQHHIPRTQLGRVASIDAFGSFALIPVGYALAAWATDLVGAPLLLIIGGSCTLLIAISMLIGQAALRQLD
jgi:MFS family permease